MPSRLHQSIALLCGVTAGLLLALITTMPTMFIAVTAWGLWTIVLAGFVYRLGKTRAAVFAATFTVCAGLLYTVIDWRPAAIVWIIVTALGTAALVWWYFLQRAALISFQKKPWRRVMMMLWVLTVYSGLSVLAAWHVFFPHWSVMALSVAGALITAIAAIEIWQLYRTLPVPRQFGWAALIALVMFEFVSVFYYFLPFGYFVMGLLLTWLWYLAQLIIRFYESRAGILWRKQRWFLLGNAIAFIIVVYLSRFV